MKKDSRHVIGSDTYLFAPEKDVIALLVGTAIKSVHNFIFPNTPATRKNQSQLTVLFGL